MLDLVIFSKDRACQLELLLRSLKRFVAGWEELNVSVVHTWSEDAYGAGYAIARELHPEVAWISERDSDAGFRALTLGRLGHGEYTAFLVDDNVFKAPFSLDAPQLRALAEDPELLCLSWRMAPRMNYCYALDTLTPIPDFTDGTVWRWPDAHGDWGYPMSVDGHVFRTAELLPLIGRLPFHNPNTFEAALAANPLPLPKAICLPDAPIVNLPVNRVQDTALNRHGDVAAAWLNERFLAGDRLAVETVIGVANPGPHHEVPLRWEGETVPAEGPAPRVSVVVPCHNLGAYLGEAVRSVLAQDMTDLEVIIVDHGSTDDSPAIADALATTDDRVRVLHRENAGHPAYSRNTGIADARADYVLCLDGDDRLDDPRFVGALANALDVRPSAVVAFGDQQDFGASTTLHQLPGWDFAALTRSNRLSTCSMFRRATWDDVDGYAPVGYEDWDFWIALGETGGTGVKVPGVAWSYRVSDTGRFSEVQPHDQANKAAIVARHPDLYTPAQRAWAQGVLDGDAAALAVPHAPFVIPEAPAVAPVMTVTGLKSFVTVALVDEVLAAPALLRRYASTFTGEDDATLIVYAPDTTPDAVVPQLASILVDVGLSDDASADVILVAAPSADGDAAVRRSAHAVLSDAAIPPTPLDELPRFAEEAIALMLGRADAPADVAPVPAPAATPRSPLHEHYARFMGPGSLVFDIGANVGDRTAIFRELGATVVAVEPQSAVVPRLRSRFADDPQVTIVPMALAAEPAELTMQLNEASTISSMAPDWVDAMRASGRFEGLEWSRTETVTATTLDALIAAHGRPAFCKVDVEGYEPEVFAGLSQPVAAASMEFVAEAPEATLRTCAHLASLGSAEFALSHGESGVLEPWTDLEGLRDELTSVAIVDPQAWGDVYVRFPELAAAAADDEPLGDELEVPADMAWTYNGGHHYEHNVVAWFDRLVDRRDTPAVYDIGANYGYFSALAASRAGSLVAFEPTAATHAVLSRNLRRVGIDPENAVKLALSDAPGTAVIHRYSSSGNNSLYERSLPPGHPLQRDGEETVQVDTLDAVFQRLELAPPEVIKIDVEGAELGVLRGGRETLRAHLPDILLEWGETTSHDAGYERRDVADELERMGYTLFGIAEDPQDMTLHPRRTFGAVAIGTLLATASPEGLVPAAPAVPAVVAHRPPGWDWYTADLHAYRELGGEVADYDLNPQLDDKTPNNPFDQHYFFQDVWAARRVADQRPHTHVDVGSRIDYVGFLTAVVPEVVFVDIRPLPVDIEGFRCVPGSILDLPFADRSLESVSCLHVAEHIGLGRYGDPLDPLGTVKAAAELQRVVAPGGQLLFSGPVGRPRTCFNAHRVHDPVAVLDMFPELELEEFSGVDDGGTFRRHRTPQELVGSTYACGMYLLRRPLG